MTDAVLAEIQVGAQTVRAVRARPSDEIRRALTRDGSSMGEEIVELRAGETVWAYVITERPTMISFDESRALVFGLLPEGAVAAEAVAPDGGRVSCTVGPGVWLVVLPNNEMGAELYPVLFLDPDGAPVNPGLPTEWEREPVGRRRIQCPACGTNAWDLVTPAWQGTGDHRSARWGHGTVGPPDHKNEPQRGRAYVCRVCGHEEMRGIGLTFGQH
jgi:hypothetical protein